MGLGNNDCVVNNCKHMILFLTRSGQILIWFRWISSHCSRSGKYASNSVSVSGMVSLSKAFIYMASIRISSTVSAVHGETRQEFTRFSNSYKHIVFL